MKIDVCDFTDIELKAILPREAFALGVLSIAVVPFSVFLNGSIILNIALRHRLRCLKSAFTLNVCIVDLFLTLFIRVPFGLNTFSLSSEICKMGMVAGHTTIALSLLAVFFLSVERYIAIFHPYQYPVLLTKRTTVYTLMLTWLIPSAFGITSYIPGVPTKAFFVTSAAVNLGLIVALVSMHSRTIYTLVKINRETNTAAARFKANVDRRCLIRRSRGVRCLTGAMVVLFACYFPLSILDLFHKGLFNKSWMRISLFAAILAALPDIMNPICILYSWKEIRTLVLRLPSCH